MEFYAQSYTFDHKESIQINSVSFLHCGTQILKKNEAIRRVGFSPSQWVLGKLPRGAGRLLDEEEFANIGAVQGRVDPGTEFEMHNRYRMEARQHFIHEDCERRVASAMLRNAAPITGNYQVGDLVCYLRQARSRGKEKGSASI